jgi:peptidyl-prolyl cis-trans isomerase C
VALAKKILQKVKAEEKKNPMAFAQAVQESSEDLPSKQLAGDLQFRSQDEFEKAYGKPVADAAFALKPGDLSNVVESPNGVFILKFTGEQPELNRTLDQVKPQISAKLARDKKTKEFDEWLKQLRETAKVTIDDKALEGVEVATAQPMPAMGGMPPPGGHPQMVPQAPMAPAAPAQPPPHK